MRILVIEEDQNFGTTLLKILKHSKYQVNLAESFKDGIYFAKTYHFDLAIIQYFPQITLDFIRQMKNFSPKTSLIILAEEYKKEFELQSLQAGASDFLTQPIDFDILLARIEVHLRFGGTQGIQIGELLIIPSEESVQFRNQILAIKGKPFEVLAYLARHQNRIISKEELLDAIWEEPKLVTPNVIEVAINQIRQKLDKPFKLQSIETIRKRGYRLNLKPNTP